MDLVESKNKKKRERKMLKYNRFSMHLIGVPEGEERKKKVKLPIISLMLR